MFQIKKLVLKERSTVVVLLWWKETVAAVAVVTKFEGWEGEKREEKRGLREEDGTKDNGDGT